MTFQWPQIVYLILTLIGLISESIKLGKTGDSAEFVSKLISTWIILFLLYAGGFFG